VISSIQIKNIQSHADTFIEFSSGVNTITGASDAGKSSIIRSLKWAAQNKPSGDAIRRHGTKKSSVEIGNVTKIRTASKHQYKLSDGTVLKAIRTDVPEEVRAELNLSSINFQEQHQPYFLISESPGQVARTLNEVGDLQIIDESIKSIKTRVKNSQAQSIYLEDQLASQEDQLESLEWAVTADEDLKVVEEKEAAAESFDKECEKVKNLLTVVEDLRGKVNAIPETSGDISLIDLDSLDFSEIDSLQKVIELVEDNQVVIPDTSEDLVTVTETLSADVSLDIKTLIGTIKDYKSQKELLDSYPPSIDDCSGMITDIQGTRTQSDEISSAINEILIAEDCLEFAEGELITGKEEYEKKLKEVGHCPVCGGDL
jgi:DNA repair protein SbcC/Rad50